MDDFYAADLDGSAITMGVTEDEYARRSYGAFLSVASEPGVYLDRHQAERLRDWLIDALGPRTDLKPPANRPISGA